MAQAVKTAVLVDRISSTPGNQTFTTVNFGGGTPKLAMIWLGRDRTTSGGAVTNAEWCFGVCGDDGTQWVVGGSSEDGQATTDTSRWGSDSHVMGFPDRGRSTDFGVKASFVSFTTNGITINVSESLYDYYFTAILFGGTGFDYDIGSTLPNTSAAGTVTVSSGFTPDFILGATLGANITGTDAIDGHVMGFGMTTPSSIFGFGFHNANGNTVTDEVAARADTSDAIFVLDSSGNKGEIYNFSYGSGDFDIVSDSANAGTDRIYYCAISVGSLGVHVGSIATAASANTTSYTSPGFEPSFIFNITTLLTSLNSSATNATAGGFGFGAADSLTEGSSAIAVASNVATSDTQSQYDPFALFIDDHDSGNGYRASLHALDATGWTYDYTLVTISGAQVGIFAIEVAPDALSIEPSASTSVPSVVQPNVSMGSLSLTPNNLSLVSSVVEPNAVLGSIALNPSPSELITAGADPSLGSNPVSVSPESAFAIIGSITPDVRMSSLSIYPPVTWAVMEQALPEVVLSSTSASGLQASAIALSLLESATMGAISLSGLVESVASSSLLSVILSSEVVTPNWAVVITSVLGDVIEGDLNLSPAPGSLTPIALGPTVLMDSATIEPTFSEVSLESIGPTVSLSSIIVTLAESVVITTSNVPIVLIDNGDVAVPGHVSARSSIHRQPVVLGDTFLSQAIATQSVDVALPNIIQESMSITAPWSNLVTVATVEKVAMGSLVLAPVSVSLVVSNQAPVVAVTGSVVVITDSALAVSESSSAAVVFGSTVVTASPESESIATSIIGSVSFGSLSISSPSCFGVIQAIGGLVVYGDVIATGVSIAYAARLNPTIVSGDLLVSAQEAVALGDLPGVDVLFGSTLSEPEGAQAIATSSGGSFVGGNLVISTERSVAASDSVAPLVHKGSVVAVPGAPASVSLSRINPSIVYGNVTVIGVASVVPSSLGGIVMGDAVVSGTSPAIAFANSLRRIIDVHPSSVSALARAIDPSIIKGGIVIEPAPASGFVRSQTSSLVQASTSFAGTSLAGPTVIYSSVVVLSAQKAIAFSSSDGPLFSSVAIQSQPATAIAVNDVVYNQEIRFGFLFIDVTDKPTATPATLLSLKLGSTVAQPLPATGRTSVGSVIAQQPSMAITPNVISSLASSLIEDAKEGDLALVPTENASVTAGVINGILISGSVSVITRPAEVDTDRNSSFTLSDSIAAGLIVACVAALSENFSASQDSMILPVSEKRTSVVFTNVMGPTRGVGLVGLPIGTTPNSEAPVPGIIRGVN